MGKRKTAETANLASGKRENPRVGIASRSHGAPIPGTLPLAFPCMLALH